VKILARELPWESATIAIVKRARALIAINAARTFAFID
jgi:hypothetical protein